MIVVTTPTGQIGRRVVRDLLERDAPVRVVTRDADRLDAGIRDRVEVVEGSHGDAGTIDRALDGAHALFWVAPPDLSRTLEEVYIDFARPAVEAVRRHRVARIVGVTALGRGTAWQDRAGLVTASIGMDDLLMSSGAAFRGLAMPSFMDNLLRQASPIRDQGVFFGPIEPGLVVPATATRDMGSEAARLLADDGWSGREEVPLLGPDDLSADDMAAIMSEVLGRPIRYQQISLDTLKRQFLDGGASESFAQGYADMFRAKAEGMDEVAARGAVGRTATGFRRFCEKTLKPRSRNSAMHAAGARELRLTVARWNALHDDRPSGSYQRRACRVRTTVRGSCERLRRRRGDPAIWRRASSGCHFRVRTSASAPAWSDGLPSYGRTKGRVAPSRSDGV